MRGSGRLLLAFLLGGPAFAAGPARASAGSSDAAVPPTTGVAIGVAPFERAGAPGATVPDVATLLAERLATKGVERVVGPAELGARAAAEPSPAEVSAWASQHALGTVVVGRATRLGSSLSVDLRVRAGRDGRVVATFIEEVARPGDLGASVERLADRVLQATELALAPRAPQPAARADTGDEGRKGGRDLVGGSSPFESDAPIKISSGQLEAFEKEGGRRLLFTDDVHASQGDLSLRSQRLEAFYPPGQSQPDRLVASGGVVVVQENKTARCDQATYHRDRQMVVCTGKDAVLTQDDDQVQGREITFHLDTKVLTVKGNAHVRIQPERRAEKDADGTPALSGGPR
jgi:lipopolysaccharide transport protein LptA